MSMAKPETQASLPPYDSLPPPSYTANYMQHPPSAGYGVYDRQQYPSLGYDQASAATCHIYPPAASYPNQHQEGFVVVLTPAQSKPSQNFFGHVGLACFVAWCCNPLFGIVSFILAMLAHGAATNGEEEEARRLGHASLGVSFAGILVMTLLLVAIMGLTFA